MNGTHQIEPRSTDRLLACLSLAIDEARLVREILQAKDHAHKLESSPAFAHRLLYLNREIELLEDKLEKVRGQANQPEI